MHSQRPATLVSLLHVPREQRRQRGRPAENVQSQFLPARQSHPTYSPSTDSWVQTRGPQRVRRRSCPPARIRPARSDQSGSSARTPNLSRQRLLQRADRDDVELTENHLRLCVSHRTTIQRSRRVRRQTFVHGSSAEIARPLVSAPQAQGPRNGGGVGGGIEHVHLPSAGNDIGTGAVMRIATQTAVAAKRLLESLHRGRPSSAPTKCERRFPAVQRLDAI